MQIASSDWKAFSGELPALPEHPTFELMDQAAEAFCAATGAPLRSMDELLHEVIGPDTGASNHVVAFLSAFCEIYEDL